MSTSKYPHLNSPIRVRGTIFANRLMAGPGLPIFAQSSENFPCDGWIAHFAEKARSGAGAVIGVGGSVEAHLDMAPVQGHMPRINFTDMTVQHRFADIAEMIKAQGSVPVMQCMPAMGKLVGYDVSDDVWSEYVEGDGSYPVKGKECPKELLSRDRGGLRGIGEAEQDPRLPDGAAPHGLPQHVRRTLSLEVHQQAHR